MAVATPSGWARDLSAYRAQAAAWQAQARLHVEGLARSIDHQLDQWQLSVAEKEIAFLLLKVSGIPMLEAKYEGDPVFAAYKARTSAFFPWPPRRQPAGPPPTQSPE